MLQRDELFLDLQLLSAAANKKSTRGPAKLIEIQIWKKIRKKRGTWL